MGSAPFWCTIPQVTQTAPGSQLFITAPSAFPTATGACDSTRHRISAVVGRTTSSPIGGASCPLIGDGTTTGAGLSTTVAEVK